ncbi:MAG: hypothetical protein M1830_000094 [Pleopsidium flavum]|nr:MAG: hypothetical protein M1830_000094 [Pleopsidium flavum]
MSFTFSETGLEAPTARVVASIGGGISIALLERARSIAAEHLKLSEILAQNFDSKTARKIGELSTVASTLRDWERTTESLVELRQLLQDRSTDSELRSLASEDISSTSEKLSQLTNDLKTSLIPQHPFANLPCLLEIRPGAGGSEAALFANDLLRMYQAFCARRSLRATLLKFEAADGSGNASELPLEEAILEIETEGAYGLFRSEAGVHRVQRVPATESKGRTHTSAASVLVLPSFPSNGDADGMGEDSFNDPSSDYYIDPKDVRTDIMRARGAGGQHVNTTDSAVRLTHLPTNTVMAIQDSRSQPKNREKAWRLLRSKLAQARRETREEEMMQMRRDVVGIAKMGRGDKVRTYNWGQQRVTDHRSGITVRNLDDIIEGGDSLENVMESVRAWLAEREIENLIADEEAAARSGTESRLR